MRQHLSKLPTFLFLLPLIVAISLYAAQDDACSAVVQQALTDLGQNCDGLERNSACYGYNKVGATFTEAQPDDFFSKASDRAPLNTVDTLLTAPLDTVNNIWGVAMMKVIADVPNSLPGQGVTFVLLGDAEVRNDVSPSEAFTPADPVDVTTSGNANIRSAASAKANVLGSVNGGTVLPADGHSPDGQWLRVLYHGAPAWISASLVNAPEAASALPVITESLRTPMQAFYVTTRIGTTACHDAPDVVMVQGPENLKVNLTINGADVEIGSTIVLRSLQSEYGELVSNRELVGIFGDLLTGQNTPASSECNATQLMVVDGEAKINDGVLKLPTGFTARSINCGGAERSSGFTTPWGGSRPMTQAELDYLQTLNNLPSNVLSYPVHVPTGDDIQQLLNVFSGGDNPNIGDVGSAAMCSAFRATSPLGTMPSGDVQFYWDAAPGATSYTVHVFDASGTPVGEYSTDGSSTSVSGNPAANDNLSWEVSAYVDGQLACSTGQNSVVRDKVYITHDPVTTCIDTFVQTCDAPCTLGAVCGIPGKNFYCTCPG